MFIDRARILISSGNGGNGMSSFRREKYVPKGGPSGGDGGKGGDVILLAESQINTLIDFRYRRIFKAMNGENGKAGNKFGKNAEDLYIKVPVGTTIWNDETGEMMADLVHDGQAFLVLSGGRGGRGNARFSTSANRAPTFAEKGEPGQEKWIRLELKVLADVGLVGYPSVGKSSFIRKVSGARPEVAAYHFTTLNPSLGVVRLDTEREFVMADIPGLIEGASKGVGLGHQFLRHIERTKVLLHLVDISSSEGRDPIEDVDIINTELKLYSDRLSQKPQIIVANKIDLLTTSDTFIEFEAQMIEKGFEVFPVCALSGEGIPELLERVWQFLEGIKGAQDTEVIVPSEMVYEANLETDFVLKREDDASYRLEGKRIEKLVSMTNFDDEQALLRFQKIWKHMNLDKFLKEKGVQQGDTVHIGEVDFEYKE